MKNKKGRKSKRKDKWNKETKKERKEEEKKDGTIKSQTKTEVSKWLSWMKIKRNP